MALSEIFYRGEIAADLAVWDGMDASSIHARAYLNTYRVEGNAEMWELVAVVFYAILQYLHGLGTRHSIGVVNSIWQSIHEDTVPDKPLDWEKMGGLPDVVGDELFSHPDVLQTPFETLQLDKIHAGTYHQVWLVDRIMREGVLWYGEYNRSTLHNSQARSEPEPELPAESPVDGNRENPRESHESHNSNASEGEDSKTKIPNTIIGRQHMRRSFATLISLYKGAGSTGTAFPEMMASGNLTAFAMAVAWGTLDPEADDARVDRLVSVFDVDGPCTVATPFNPDWEVLPHPACRSMSVCWVVEPIQDGDVVAAEENSAQSMSRGGGGRKGKDPERLGIISESCSESADGRSEASSSGEKPTFRVLNKVRGMWEIMDMAWQEYWFT